MRKLYFIMLMCLLTACGSASSTSLPEPTAVPIDRASADVTPSSQPIIEPSTIPLLQDQLPTQPAQPTDQPQPPAQPTDQPQQPTIEIDLPPADAVFDSSARVSGVASITPFEKTIIGQVRDAEGNILGQTAINTTGEYGEPAYFDAEIAFNAPATTRPGKIVIIDFDEQDGGIFAIGAVDVTLAGYSGTEPRIILPAAQQRLTLPLHIEVGGLQAGLDFSAELRYADGTILQQTGSAVEGGWLVMNLQWATESQPPQPDSQSATLHILYDGNPVLQQDIYMLAANDFTQPVNVYFVLGEQLQKVVRHVPDTSAIAAASVRELSWGPAGNELYAAGMDSVLPSPDEIANYPGRQPDWSGRAYLRSIRIANGTAYIDWSPEMAAWGGGSAALGQLYNQVATTLTEYGSISAIIMTVNGSEDVLQP